MSDYSIVLFADLDTGKLVGADGTPLDLPDARLGDSWRITLRFLGRINGVLRERDLNIRAVSASIGPVLTAPVSGGFKLDIDGSNTASIAWDATADAVSAAITAANGAAAGLVVTLPAPACWLVRKDIPIAAADDAVTDYNTLAPQCFVRVREFTENGFVYHEIRLIQSPYAFTSNHDRVLPPEPVITRVQAGDPGDDDTAALNEIQKLRVTSDFRGTIRLTTAGRTTEVLGTSDGPAEIAAALNALYPGATLNFSVTNPENEYAYIEFIGDLAGLPQELIAVTVNSFPPGAVTLTLPLDRAPMAAALRTVNEKTVPLEIEVRYVGDDEDPDDEDVVSRVLTLCQQDLKCVREQIWDALATVPAIDWLHPVSPENYIPFTLDQVITGTQFYVVSIGDGLVNVFNIAHGLDTEDIASVVVRENISAGRILQNGGEYTVTITNENTVQVTFGGDPPDVNSLVVIIATAGPASVFQAHTHTESQVVDLVDDLNDIRGRLATLEALGPILSIADTSETATDRAIVIEDFEEIYPLRPGAALKLTRPPHLLPAIHDLASIAIASSTNASPAILTTSAAHRLITGEKVTISGVVGSGATVLNGSSRIVTVLSPTTFSAGINTSGAGTGGTAIPELVTPLPSASARPNTVVVNKTGAAVLIPGGGGRAGSYVEADGYVACDSREWYVVDREGSTNSFFARDFVRRFFELPINSAMWAAGEIFQLVLDLELQTLGANTIANYLLVIEQGAVTAETSPATTGTNIKTVAWDATPVLRQELRFTGTRLKHHFGVRVRRSVSNVMTTEKLLYDAWSTGSSAPATPDFMLRARLIQFDVQDDVDVPKGYVSVKAFAINANFR